MVQKSERESRVLLLRPPGKFHAKTFPDGPWISIPNGLLYLASTLKSEQGLRVQLIDALAAPDLEALERATPPFLFGMSWERIVEEAKPFAPTMIGITAHSYHYFDEFLLAVEQLHNAFPDAFLFAGGPDITADYERYFAAAPALQAVVLDEGEETTKELAIRLRDGEDWHNVQGLVWKKPDGTLVKTPKREWLRALEEYEPDYSLIDFEQYFRLNRLGFRARVTYGYPGIDRTVDMVTSRGCPYPCTFCSNPFHMGKLYRPESVSSVLDRIAWLVNEKGVRHIHFEDDNLSLQRERFRQLLLGLIERKLHVTWDTPNGIRVDSLDEELLEIARISGCSHMIFGAETGNRRVLKDVLKKNFTLEDTERAAAMCQKAKIDTLAFYMVGAPGEYAAEIEDTFSFAFYLYERYGTTPLLQLWRPVPGTEMYDQAKARNKITSSGADQLHEEFAVPYVSFKSDMLENPEFTAEDFGRLHKRWTWKLQVIGAKKWGKMLGTDVSAWGRLLGDASSLVLDREQSWRQKLESARARLYDRAAYPFAYLRRVGEVWEEPCLERFAQPEEARG